MATWLINSYCHYFFLLEYFIDNFNMIIGYICIVFSLFSSSSLIFYFLINFIIFICLSSYISYRDYHISHHCLIIFPFQFFFPHLNLVSVISKLSIYFGFKPNSDFLVASQLNLRCLSPNLNTNKSCLRGTKPTI